MGRRPAQARVLITDPLTGTYSRASFAGELDAALASTRAAGGPCSLLLLDLDHFKSINDAFGHARGDAVLVAVAGRLAAALRRDDRLSRHGGDEFVILLPGMAKAGAVRLARRLIESVQEPPLAGEPPLSIGVSVGVATFPEDAGSADALLALADARHYAAKRGGRGRVVAASEGASEALAFDRQARLVEREEAVAAAHRFVARVCEGGRGVLAVGGPPGSGRSRLLAEVGHAARLRGLGVAHLGGERAAPGAPLSALWAALREGERSAAVAGGSVVSTFLGAMAERGRRGLIILVDDPGRIDSASLIFLRWMAASADFPCLGIAYARADADGDAALLGEDEDEARVALRPLSPEGLRVWLRALLRWEPPPALIDRLMGESDGLPAEVERRLRAMEAGGDLRRVDGGWELRPMSSEATQASAPPLAPAGPPAILSSFVGREGECAALHALLGTSRLVTITGEGGVGKTRLALALAADRGGAGGDGVAFVPLTPAADEPGVLAAIARALDVREGSAGALEEEVALHLARRPMLLILDNFEQALAGAALVGRLLGRAPGLRVLVTSREALAIRGEQRYRLAPLAAPPAGAGRADDAPGMTAAAGGETDAAAAGGETDAIESLRRFPAVTLFVERARAARPEFALTATNAADVAAICARLDGLPLAIELAAARVALFSPAALRARLEDGGGALALLTGGARDLPAHQRTLRGTIRWSYALLSPEERSLFRRLTVFAGGCTLDAVEAVVAQGRADASAAGGGEASGGDAAPLDGVASLIAKSLVRVEEADGEPRLTMLATVRDFALERLDEAGEAARTANDHAGYYLRLAEEAEPALAGPEQARGLRRLEREYENLCGALDHLIAGGAVAAALRLSGAIWRLWNARGWLSEGRRWLAAVLAAAARPGAAEAPPLLLARAHNGAGVLAQAQGEYAAARASYEQGLALFRAAPDGRGTAAMLGNLALVSRHQGDYQRARELNEAALALFRDLGDEAAVARCLNNLGAILEDEGELGEAGIAYEQSLTLRRRLGDRRGVAITLANLGVVAEHDGDPARAAALYGEGLRLAREVGDARTAASALARLAGIAAAGGDDATARQRCSEALVIFRRAGDRQGIAASLEALARHALPLDGPAESVRLLAAAAALRRAIDAPVPRVDREAHEALLATLRGRLDRAAFEGAWLAGEANALADAAVGAGVAAVA